MILALRGGRGAWVYGPNPPDDLIAAGMVATGALAAGRPKYGARCAG